MTPRSWAASVCRLCLAALLAACGPSSQPPGEPTPGRLAWCDGWTGDGIRSPFPTRPPVRPARSPGSNCYDPWELSDPGSPVWGEPPCIMPAPGEPVPACMRPE